ncbi:MAG TPA: hypothetical protein DCX82_15530 [Lachnospiraceae bacterium]|jgi:hypothetical protein|nr:hypothetical protein [Lachnospiraceae bacterium]
MKAMIIETGKVIELPEVAVYSDDLVQGTVKRVDTPNYEFEMSQEDFDWWSDVQQGIGIAKEEGIDALEYEYEDYINLVD